MRQLLIGLALLTICYACKENTNTANAENEIMDEKIPEVSTEEWITLFDGSSLEHWRGYLKEEMPNEWSIQEDALAFTPGEQGGKNIITKEKFTNFILSLEWKISENGNSGIFWGVYEDEQFPEAYQTGPEIQVLHNEGHPDGKIDTHVAGSLYDMIAAQRSATRPAGEWNLCVLEVNHNTNLGKLTLNGREQFTFPVHGEAWDAMVANSKFKDWKGFGDYHTGHIGLQDHSDKVWYRNIKIKKLD